MTSLTEDQVFGRDFLGQIVDWIEEHTEPDEVFSAEKLKAWAEENGYVKEDDQ